MTRETKARDPEDVKFRAVMRKLKMKIMRGPIDEVTKQLITADRRPLRQTR